MNPVTSTAAKRGLTAWERWLIVGSLGLAVLLLVAALVVPMLAGWSEDEQPSWWTWLDAVLINAGAAIALVAPIEWFSSKLRREVEESEERQDERVQAVREESASNLAAVAERVDALTEFDRRVEQQVDDVVAADHSLFRRIAEADATSETAYRVLTRAAQRGLISARGVRVPYNNEHPIHVVFTATAAAKPQVRMRVTGEDEQTLITMIWSGAKTTAEAMLVQLATSLRNKGIDARPSATMILDRLAETLVIADRHDFARPIIQYFYPQWALTDTAIVALSAGGWRYEVAHRAQNRAALYEHVRSKPWVDEDSFESAWFAAEKLFPLTAAQHDYGERDRQQKGADADQGRS